MRYGKDQKQATRQRIVEAAGRRFKQDGIDGAGVAALMSDAGLTNGAFYGHFSSKEDLVANVLADQLRAQRQSLDAQPSDRAGLEAFVRSYLSPQHRDQCADGCPSAALLDEIARRPAATRQVFTDELMGEIDDIASRLDPTDVEAARTDALTVFGHDGRHPAARQGTDRPRPVRSAPRPRRGDGPEAARRPGMTASQHTPRQATTTATSGLRAADFHLRATRRDRPEGRTHGPREAASVAAQPPHREPHSSNNEPPTGRRTRSRGARSDRPASPRGTTGMPRERASRWSIPRLSRWTTSRRLASADPAHATRA